MLLYYSYLPVKHSTVNSQASHSSLCADSLCHLAPIYGEEVYYRLGQVCFFFEGRLEWERTSSSQRPATDARSSQPIDSSGGRFYSRWYTLHLTEKGLLNRNKVLRCRSVWHSRRTCLNLKAIIEARLATGPLFPRRNSGGPTKI